MSRQSQIKIRLFKICQDKLRKSRNFKNVKTKFSLIQTKIGEFRLLLFCSARDNVTNPVERVVESYGLPQKRVRSDASTE